LNRRRQARLYRLVSYATIVGFVSVGVIAPRPSAAQGAAPMQVGVIEFGNESGVQGNLLARFATDAVVIELSKSNRFDVITRPQMEAQMKELGIALPLNSAERARLGEALAAEAMIEGAVKAVELRGSGDGRRAAVTIVVRMVDQASGQVINGAIQTGSSNARVGYAADDDKLIAEASDNAAYLAVRTMIDYIIPEATVQNTIRTNEVMLNKGARDGIRAGMRMIITREREVIGEVIVKQVDPDNSTATVTKQTRGIKPEDKARAVFDMPEVPRVKAGPATRTGTPPVTTRKMGGMSSIVKTLISVGVLWAVINMFQTTGEHVGSVTAEAGAPGSLPIATPGVKISWERDKLAKLPNVIEYHVWRDNVDGPVLVSLGPLPFRVAYDDTATRDVDYVTVDPQTHEQGTGTTDVPALTLGVPHVYYVSAVYVVESVGEAMYYETERKFAGMATPIAPIASLDLIAPAENSLVNLNGVTFQWRSRGGADTYIVEALYVPETAGTSVKYASSTVYFPSGTDGQAISLAVGAGLYNAFASVPEGKQIRWRVGARSSRDKPGPVPDAESNRRFVYSDYKVFIRGEEPPPPPTQ